MIKRFILTQILFLIMVTITQAQNNQDLTHYIESQKEDIENFVKLSTTRLEVKPIKVEGFDSYDDSNFRDLSVFEDEDSVKSLIEEFTNMDVNLLYPYNLVEFRFDDDEYAQRQGESYSYFNEYPEELPFYEPVKILFKDGKTEKVKKYVNQRLIKESFKENDREARPELSVLENYCLEEYMYSTIDLVGFYTSKPIQCITVKVTLNTPEFTSYRLTKNGQVAETPDGKIELVGISGDQLTIKLPATLEDRFTVLPLYKDGRVLKEQSSSLNSGYGEQATPKLLKVINLYDQALSEVKNGKLNSTDEIDAFMEAGITKKNLTITEAEQVLEKTQKLRGPISEVIVKIKNEKPNKQTFTFEMAVDSYEEEEEESSKKEFIVASDFKTEKYGIVDLKGDWVVQPEFSYYFGEYGSHFYSDYSEENGYTYYFFDTKKKQLKPVYFIPTDKEAFAERYIIIKENENDSQGVFDLKTGKIVIPVTEYSIKDLVENRYWLVYKTKEGSHSSGVLDENGAIIIPPNQMQISYRDGFFYVENDLDEEDYPDAYPRTQPDMYTLEGSNITQGKYNTIEGKFMDGVQFVTNIHYKKTGKNIVTQTGKDHYLIDTDGKVLAEFPKDEYKEVHPFENGLARIQNAVGFYGFISKDGQTALPYDYVFATDFKGKYALAQFNQDGQSVTAFIDKNGKVVKILPAAFKDLDYHGDKPYVLLKNKETYFFDGKPY